MPGITVTRELDVGGAAREFALHVPGTPDPTPDLLVVLHWWGGSMEEAAASGGWTAASDAGGFLVAFGSGIDHSWNAGSCCGTASEQGVDDVAYVDALIRAVDAEHRIGRVVVAGISNGAMMALRFGCESSTEADIAAVSGSLFADCRGAPPRDVVMINGLLDETVRYDGAPGSLGVAGLSVPDAFATWRAIDDCAEPTRSAGPDALVHVDTARCADGRQVRLITIDDAAHQWPSSRYGPTEAIIAFTGIGRSRAGQERRAR